MIMPPKHQDNVSEEHRKIIKILVPLFLIIALPFVLLAARQQTVDRHFASEFQDLNSAAQITQTNNADGSMGSMNTRGNYSNTLPQSLLGTVSLIITDSTDTQTTNVPSQVFSSGNGGSASSNNLPSEMSSLSITLSKAEVHLANTPTISPSPSQSNGTWEVLNINAPRTIDLIELAKGNFALLGVTNLAAGQYTEVRLYISKASAILTNGTSVTLDMPGRNNIVRIVRPFTVDASATTTLTADFDVIHSLHQTGNGYIFKPVVSQFIESHGIPTTPAPSPVVSIVTPPIGCYYRKPACTIVCPTTHPDCCLSVLICPSGTPSVSPTPICLPRPSCLDAVPRCLIPEPKDGWCAPTLTQQVSPMPTVACLPKPSCLTANPPTCELPEPIGGWCPSPTSGQLSGGQLNSVMTYLNNILRALLKTR